MTYSARRAARGIESKFPAELQDGRGPGIPLAAVRFEFTECGRVY